MQRFAFRLGCRLYQTRVKHSYQVMVSANENKSSYFNLADWGRKNAPVKLTAGKHDFKIVYDTPYTAEGAALIQNADDLMHSACVK